MNLDKSTYDQHTKTMQSHINVGFGADVTIAELAIAVAKVIGYQGKITFDHSKPDGSPRKWMDSSKLNHLGWQPQTSLREGLELTYQNFINQ
jgi:GDP-L-fucose synthase